MVAALRDREQRDQERKPVVHVSRCAHAAKYALPPRMNEKVARKREVDERAGQQSPAGCDAECGQNPDDNNDANKEGLKPAIAQGRRLDITAPAFGREETMRL